MLRDRVSRSYARVPYLRSLPFASFEIIALVGLANVVVWIAAGIALHFYPHLSSSAVLAYTLGLRHALDADHISAIDLTTRRLLAVNPKPVVTVGMWFSLGHSTIVILTTVLVAATTASITAHFDAFSSVGGIIGSSVSTAFLLVLGAMNGWLFWRGVQNLKRVIQEERATAQLQPLIPMSVENPVTNDSIAVAQTKTQKDVQESIQHSAKPIPSTPALTADEELHLRNRSCLNTLLRWSSKIIDRPWKIYPLGVLFGLGFDTSSEIALLGITTLESHNVANGSAVWAILIFPLLFTSGMCLLDTTDGALMYALYSSGAKGSQLTVAYANVVLTGFTVLIAVGIGILQMLNMLSNVLPQWRLDENPSFWDGVAIAGDRYDIIGGSICAAFVVVAGVAWAGFKPWKRVVIDRRKQVIDTAQP